MALDVVAKQRLLDPVRIERGISVDGARGMRDVPALVGVDHQRARPDELADPPQALDVLLDVWLADLDLEGLEAVRLPALHLLDERIERLVQVDAAGIGQHALATPAEHGDQRLPRLLRHQVPKRDVEGR
jgi:hypothetical protein